MSNISRQYGLTEIPGTEEPAPAPKRAAVSLGFESQMRDYVGAIWLKMGELERKVVSLEEWREGLASPGPLSSATPAEAKGERYGGEPGSTMVGVRAVPPKPSSVKARGKRPWEDDGVSKATWYRRNREGA